MIWFVEQHTGGKWTPALIHGAKPVTRAVNGRLYLSTADGISHRIRSEPCRINKGHEKSTLTQIREVYSRDGKFRGSK